MTSSKERKTLESFGKEIGKALREYRELQGLTQSELAKIVGTEQSEISRMEAGEKVFNLIALVRLTRTTELRFTIDIHSGAPELISQEDM